MKTLILVFLVWSFPVLVRAQEATLPPLPQGSIPANLEFAKWKVTIKSDPPASSPAAGASPAQAPRPASAAGGLTIVVTKTKNLREVDVVFDTGEKFKSFVINGTQYLRNQDGSWSAMTNSTNCPVYSNADFPELSWVAAKNYVAVGQAAGLKCFVFADQISSVDQRDLGLMEAYAKGSGQPLDLSKYAVGAKAMVDMATLLPVSLHKADQTFTYRFDTPPSDMLVVPPELLRRLQTQQGIMRDMSRKPAAS